jgi:gamma-glutamyl-gamma-aminobutyrate hydrolase PuuD
MKVALLFRNTLKEPPYRQALERVGLEPIAFTPGSSESLDSVRGIVLTGGTDVDPSLYGQERHPRTDEPDRERDDYESAVLRDALSRDTPVLAICRGMQLLNVVLGGTLLQHVENHKGTVHDVVRAGVPEAGERITVNSRHHQAVGELGRGLVVTGRDPADGVIEEVRLPDRKFVVGVQWHPEEMPDDPVQRRLFEMFRNCF